MTAGEKYYEKLDVLKGLAVFMVVWGHLIDNENILFRYLNNLHLPLFFIISGYLLGNSLSRHTLRRIFVNKICRLLIPFLSWSSVAFILKVIILIEQQSFSGEKIFEIFIKVFVYADSVWFLWILFLGSCLVVLYEKLNKNKIVGGGTL